MVDTLKVLGQIKPAITTLTTAYMVPAATQTTVSSVIICNEDTSPTTFRISIAIAGASDTTAQYIYYDLPILNNDTFIATIGVTLATTDVIRVQSASGLVSFNFFGVEIT